MTVVIQIGNSDNKLSQSEWSHFVAEVRREVEHFSHEIHFCGGSDWDAPWQNACFVCEVNTNEIADLVDSLVKVRRTYNQESVAWMAGVSKLI